MTAIALIFVTLTSTAYAAGNSAIKSSETSAATAAASATPVVSTSTSAAAAPGAAAVPASAAVPVISATPEVSAGATPAANSVTLPAGPTAKNKKLQFSVRTAITTCTPAKKDECQIDTFVVATALSNPDPVWERRIYFQNYDVEKPVESQAILVRSLKLVGKSMMIAVNSRGDAFELELGYGNMKKPKSAREYRK